MKQQLDHQNHKYLARLYAGTRFFLTQKYQQLPLRAPLFVETTFSKLDGIADPFVCQLTTIVDERVNTTLEILLPVTDCAIEIGQKQVVDRYNNIVLQGKNLQQKVQSNTQLLLKESVDLALHNKATALVLNGAGVVSTKILDSIELRIKKLSKLVRKDIQDEEQSDNTSKNYQQRMVDIATQFSSLSNFLYCSLRSEISQQQQVNNVYLTEARLLVQAHYRTMIQVINRTILFVTLDLLSQNKAVFRSFVHTIKEKMNKKQLIQYLNDQFNLAKEQLTYQQIQNIYQVLRESNILDKSLRKVRRGVRIYKTILEAELNPKQIEEKQQDKVYPTDEQTQETETKQSQKAVAEEPQQEQAVQERSLSPENKQNSQKKNDLQSDNKNQNNEETNTQDATQNKDDQSQEQKPEDTTHENNTQNQEQQASNDEPKAFNQDDDSQQKDEESSNQQSQEKKNQEQSPKQQQQSEKRSQEPSDVDQDSSSSPRREHNSGDDQQEQDDSQKTQQPSSQNDNNTDQSVENTPKNDDKNGSSSEKRPTFASKQKKNKKRVV